MSHRTLVTILVAGMFLSGLVAAQSSALAPVAYRSDGSLAFPDVHKWVFVGAGLFSGAPGQPQRFSNVYVEPGAFEVFMRTGIWPDRTVIFSEKRAAVSTLPITANPGFGQTGEMLGAEFEVKDAARGGWMCYTAGAGENIAKPVADQKACTECHRQHAAVDNVFVQFYPSLVGPARQHGTYRASTN